MGGLTYWKRACPPSYSPPVIWKVFQEEEQGAALALATLPLPQGAHPQAPSPHSPPQTFTEAGGITSSVTLGERRAGVKVADQRGPGPGTALAHRTAEAG